MARYQQVYGKLDTEAGGRLSGTMLYVGQLRRDGKYPVTHVFGSGKRIQKLYTAEQVDEQIAKVTKGW